MFLGQAAPTFDQIVNAVQVVGFPIVMAVLILTIVVAPLFLLARLLITSMGNKADNITAQIGNAVTLFAGTLGEMRTRNEQSSDDLARAIERHTEASIAQSQLIAAMNESIRIQLNFTTQQMTQQAALTQKVSDATSQPTPITGVIKSVE